MSKSTQRVAESPAPEAEPSPKAAERRPHEAWRADNETPAFFYEGARIQNGWAIGQLLTQEEYLGAIDRFAKVPFGTAGRR